MAEKKTAREQMVQMFKDWAAPKPHNLSIPVDEYLTLLATHGAYLVAYKVDGQCCKECNDDLKFWWDQSNLLPKAERIVLQRAVKRITGGNLPDAPWDDA